MINNSIKKINDNKNLTYDETKQAFDEILSGRATTKQISDFITGLGFKEETPTEIAGTIDAINSHIQVPDNSKYVLNKKGLRKDYSNSINF
ncbi:hypothetical protein ACFQAV_12810 [Companilactobacillus huachuanensis]|uniref:Glycosyl transferase family 3 N-terminal domain-containing protein n=1 Tax=Companilactobacillus huachuanensis TaxID=2559914 RepID=A0ABW1RQH7_9LACO|nr:hypothetical protein [Companilactobacillus huachuanensis]